MRPAKFSYEDIAKICSDLTEKKLEKDPHGNDKITVDEVRMALGSGSNTTILAHMQTWRAKEKERVESRNLKLLGENFLSVVNQELTKFAAKCNQEKMPELDAALADLQSTLNQLKQSELDLTKANQRVSELETANAILISDLEKLKSDHSDLVQELQSERKIAENARIETIEVKALLKNAQEIKDENERLKKDFWNCEKDQIKVTSELKAISDQNDKLHATLKTISKKT